MIFLPFASELSHGHHRGKSGSEEEITQVHYSGMLDDSGRPSRLEVSIRSTTSMKRPGVLLTRVPTHLILYVIYMLHTACHSFIHFAFISLTAPVA